MKYWNSFWFYFNLAMAIMNASAGSIGFAIFHLGLAYLFYTMDDPKKGNKDENNRTGN